MKAAPIITTTCASPVGDLTLTWSDGALTGLFMQDQRHSPAFSHGWVRDDDALAAVAGQLAAYFDGTLTTFDVPLRLQGTEFQVRVWEALRGIPYGETISYGELARRVGNPSASRAVGLANGRNPVAIIVPCHRVIGADGSLTGYGGGLWRKKILLELERAESRDGRRPLASRRV
ncbi:MAG TPA: methylated-DNA--[protein]-cysteine S-methyltransferase [Acidimicrobiales bacterium]|nr:methylated-DNA--[protein]-cysteine S-methyltransferase [Acidimicrobiales bacterium]